MKKFLKLFLGFLILTIVLFFLFFNKNIIIEKLSIIKINFYNLASIQNYQKKILELEQKNNILSLEIERLNTNKNFLNDKRYEYKIARVYSRYPFNDSSFIVIDVGSDDGIKEHMPVFVEKGILLGRVRTVKRTQSEVETIFNSSWKTSVSIGSSSQKAIYVGGNKPIIDLLSKESDVSSGDIVFSISPEFPFGSILGKIDSVSFSSYEPWKQAKIDSLFNLDDFSMVYVLLNFP